MRRLTVLTFRPLLLEEAFFLELCVASRMDSVTEPINRRYLDALLERVLVFDGAMGTSLQRLQLSAADFGGERLWGCNDYLVISKPGVVEDVHNSFLAVGCDVVETCTFRANRLSLREYGLQDQIVSINRAAAQLARRSADQYSTAGRPRF